MPVLSKIFLGSPTTTETAYNGNAIQDCASVSECSWEMKSVLCLQPICSGVGCILPDRFRGESMSSVSNNTYFLRPSKLVSAGELGKVLLDGPKTAVKKDTEIISRL